MKKNYYLYAGYYEIHISAHELPKPFTLISRHRKFERAMEVADKFDSDAYKVFYKDTVEDLGKYLEEYYGVDLHDPYFDFNPCIADKDENNDEQYVPF